MPNCGAGTGAKLGFPPPDAFTFITQCFLGPFYQQGPYWFLGMLLFFMVLFVVATVIVGSTRPAIEKPIEKSRATPWAALTVLGIVSVMTYYLSGRYVTSTGEWLNVGYILYFQPSRFVGYLFLFALGVHGWRRGWFTEDGWSPNVLVWGAASLVSSALLIGPQYFIIPFHGVLFGLVYESFSYNATTISMTFFLSGLFSKAQNFPHNITKYFEEDSYGIYWLHIIVLIPILYALKPLDVPIVAKWHFRLRRRLWSVPSYFD